MPPIRLPESFQTYPSYRFLGIVEEVEGAEAVVRGVESLGLHQQLWVLTGSDATHVLDPEGVEHGLWARLARIVQKLGYESMQLAEYNDAALAGGWVIGVQLAASGEHKDEVRDLFARFGGRNLRFFGTFGIEDVLLNAPVTQVAMHAIEDEAARVEEVANVAREGAEDRAAAREMVDEGAPVVAGEGMAPPKLPTDG